MRLLRVVLLLPFLAGCSAVSPPAGSAVRSAGKAAQAAAVRSSPGAGKAIAKRQAGKPAPPARPGLRTYQCLFEDKLVHLRAAAVDRSGQKVPEEVLSHGFSGYPVGLVWKDAPAGMDYHEEILGSWQGRRIMLSSYHGVTSLPEGGTEEWTHCLVSCEDSEKIPRPFLVIQKSEGGITDLKCELRPSSTQPTELSANWFYSGSGVMWYSAGFRFSPDGPRLVKLLNGGRHGPVTIRTYNSTGRMVKTHTASDPW